METKITGSVTASNASHFQSELDQSLADLDYERAESAERVLLKLSAEFVIEGDFARALGYAELAQSATRTIAAIIVAREARTVALLAAKANA